MTDRINGLTITLDKDIRDDDIQSLITAILMMRGVIHVEPNIVSSLDHFARARMKDEIRDKMYDFIKENL